MSVDKKLISEFKKVQKDMKYLGVDISVDETSNKALKESIEFNNRVIDEFPYARELLNERGNIVELNDTDYVHAWNKVPCVTLDNGCSCGLDAIWHESSVLEVEYDSTGFEWNSIDELPKECRDEWVRMTDLPKKLQEKYLNYLKRRES
jgi:hypothetical protein